MKTSTIPETAPAWYVLDADGQSLGRMAAKVAHVLRGKHKAQFSPHQMCGDEVIIINAAKIDVDTRKLLQKLHFSYSGHFGSVRSQTLRERMGKTPERVLEDAVKGMLPKNRLRQRMLKRLHVFAGSEHPHAAQKPMPFPSSPSI
ncbi:50S ribosomal protein L13 [Candidatus Peribacteria bacterium]|nr:50S ribosomal protein L13 [Candidatus Peribacteria bacterium]